LDASLALNLVRITPARQSVSMRSILARRARPSVARIHPALRSFADECGDALVRMLAYVGGLVMIGFIAFATANVVADVSDDAAEPMVKPSWSQAPRSRPAFAVSQINFPGKTEAYEILRHPDGGRKDVLRWAAAGEAPVAELEIYRAGAERFSQAGPADDIAARMDPEGTRETETAGVIDSKFGPVRLLGFVGVGRPCLGFVKNLDAANLRLSGWSCQADSRPAQRAAIACMLSRLVMLNAGNDAKLAELFARAELKRESCGAAPATLPDWIAAGDKPPLRGRIIQN
jgi:hypothetical protein